MNKVYKRWLRQMGNLSDSELKGLYSVRIDEYDDKRMAIEAEMINRGFINTDDIKKLIKIDNQYNFIAAKLLKQKKELSEIKEHLQQVGLNEEGANKLINELTIWHKNAKKKENIGNVIVTAFVVLNIVLYGSWQFVLVPGLLGILLVYPLLTATKPKRFKKKTVKYFEGEEN